MPLHALVRRQQFGELTPPYWELWSTPRILSKPFIKSSTDILCKATEKRESKNCLAYPPLPCLPWLHCPNHSDRVRRAGQSTVAANSTRCRGGRVSTNPNEGHGDPQKIHLKICRESKAHTQPPAGEQAPSALGIGVLKMDPWDVGKKNLPRLSKPIGRSTDQQ